MDVKPGDEFYLLNSPPQQTSHHPITLRKVTVRSIEGRTFNLNNWTNRLRFSMDTLKPIGISEDFKRYSLHIEVPNLSLLMIK